MSAKRCAAVAPNDHDFSGQRCGKYAGHRGMHTALIASEFLRPQPAPAIDIGSAMCPSGFHAVRGTYDPETGRWFLPGKCPACAGVAAAKFSATAAERPVAAPPPEKDQ